MTEDKLVEDRRPNSLAARDIAYHVHAQTNLDAHLSQGPFTIVRGEALVGVSRLFRKASCGRRL